MKTISNLLLVLIVTLITSANANNLSTFSDSEVGSPGLEDRPIVYTSYTDTAPTVSSIDDPSQYDDESIVGLGGPLMYNPETDECVQSLNTRQTQVLKSYGFEMVEECPKN